MARKTRGGGIGTVRPTLKTVAEATGLAVTTVSRALSGDPAIAEATRARVTEAADRLGYVPDRAAQRLRTGRTKVVTLLINPAHEYLGFTSELMDGISEALRGTGYNVTIVPDALEGDRLAAIRNILRHRLADGIVFTRTECFDPRARLLMEADFPFVTHGRTDFTTPHPFVDYDNEAFARAAVERLVALGCSKATVILPEERFTFAQHIRYGFLSAVRAAGIDYEFAEDVTVDSDPGAIAAAVRARLAAPDPPDGYVCVGEVIAMSTMAALADSGIRPGEGIYVVGKHASPIFDMLRPRIETVTEDIRETGLKIGRFLLARIDGEPVERLQAVEPPIGHFGPG